MKNFFHIDVDNENMEIANRIFEDSKQFSEGDISKPNLENILNKKHTSKKIFKKSLVYAMASAIAACLIILVGIKVIPTLNLQNHSTENNSVSTNKSFVVASDYTEIYEKLSSLAFSNHITDVYNEFAIMEDGDETYGSYKDAGATTGFDSITEKDFYNTNEQTENVHEADIVKTDGNYIYTLKKSTKDKIIITKVDGMNMKNINRISYDYKTIDINELYLYENRLVAVGSKWKEKNFTFTTMIYVYNIEKPEDASLIKCISQDGSYTSSRMKDNYLYTISKKNVNAKYFKTCDGTPENYELGCFVPIVDCYPVIPSDICIPENPNSTSYTVITSLDVTSPSEFLTSKSVLGGSSEIYVSQNNIYVLNYTYDKKDILNTKLGKDAATCFPIYDNQLIDFDNPEKTPLKIQSKETNFYAPSNGILKYSYSDGDIKYHVKNHLEMIGSDYSLEDLKAYISTDVYKATTITEIVKYQYNNGKVEYIASNQIDGHAENNLNFDEKDGYLRCVTTENSYSNLDMVVKCYDKKDTLLYNFIVDSNTLESANNTNNIYVLDDNLNIKAEIANLAEEESIYSARYFGNYGYFVTYEETDPLFSVDFSNIENPKIIGELKMPGVSEYLHFYNENKLLGFGFEETNNSRYLKLEMYDVSNGIAEKEAKTILDNYCNSEALYEYKAIMVDPEKNIIGFQADCYDEVKDQWPNYYVVYSYENNNFTEQLKIKLGDIISQVRGFYIDDYLYIVTLDWEINSANNITAINMKTYNDDKKVERIKLK